MTHLISMLQTSLRRALSCTTAWVLALGLVAGITGCSSESQSTLQLLQALNPLAADPTLAPLAPKFRYLRVTVNEAPSIWVLGYIEPDERGPIEVWYSTRREVLRLQNARVIGSAGLAVNWVRTTQEDVPTWEALLDEATPRRWHRTRDLMPGYRYAIDDRLVIARSQAPLGTALETLDASTLVWFEERVEGSDLPGARFAFEGASERDAASGPAARARAAAPANPLYGEQCLSVSLCLTWQRWPPTAPAAP